MERSRGLIFSGFWPAVGASEAGRRAPCRWRSGVKGGSWQKEETFRSQRNMFFRGSGLGRPPPDRPCVSDASPTSATSRGSGLGWPRTWSGPQGSPEGAEDLGEATRRGPSRADI
eukprot:7772997-Pyramimonas_sp.AAC.1